MAKIWTMGELLVEIMRAEVNVELSVPGNFIGPYPSGAPAIFIDTIAKLGHSCGIIGGVGKDDFGKCLLERLQKDGVDCKCVQTSEENDTGAAFVTYYEDGSRRFLFHLKNTAAVEVEEPAGNLTEEAEFFHIMGCSLMADTGLAKKILNTMEKFCQAGAKISFDPNIRPELFHGKSMELIQRVMDNCNIYLPGVEELLTISGEKSIEAAVKKSFENSKLEILVLKDGSRGSVIYTRDTCIKIEVYPIDAKDATGAGDCFDGAFICALAEGIELEMAGKMASAAAAINTAAFGPMEGKTTRENISKMIKA